MRIALLVALLTIGPAGAGVAYADSDGYYCIGRGYLAYQFGMAPGRSRRIISTCSESERRLASRNLSRSSFRSSRCTVSDAVKGGST